MKHIGWVVREYDGSLIRESFARTRRECINRYTGKVRSFYKQLDRDYASEKKLGYVDKCVKVYVEAK